MLNRWKVWRVLGLCRTAEARLHPATRADAERQAELLGEAIVRRDSAAARQAFGAIVRLATEAERSRSH